MGYRYYLGSFPKEDNNETRHMTVEDCKKKQEETEYEWMVHRPEGYEEILGLGKGVQFNEKLMLKFYGFNVYDEFMNDFHIVKKEGLKEFIKAEHDIIAGFYRDYSDEELLTYCKEKNREWNSQFGLLPYYLDEEHTDGEIVRSWKREYAIFNLVYIYRKFDWDNNYLILSAW